MPVYLFHGGCHGCTNDIGICPSCKYMESNWFLPDKNPVHIEEERVRATMIKKAEVAQEMLKAKRQISDRPTP